MPVTEAGDGWDVTVEDGVMVWEFRPGMELAAFADDAYPVFERLLESHDITAMVTAVDLDDPFSEAVFEIWEESAERAEKPG